MQPIRRFAPDAAILFSDILVIPWALGQDLDFVEGKGPVLEPLPDVGSIARLSLTRGWSRLESTYETVERVRSQLPEEICLIGFAGAPWTVATYMIEGGSSRDFARSKRWAYADPNGFQTLIDLLVEATIRHLSSQISAGATVVKIFDSWAGVLAPAEFRRWAIGPARRIADAIKSLHPNVPIIGFPRGAGIGYVEYAGMAGIDAVALDTGVPTAWAAQALQKCLPVQGNMDPVALLVGGDAMSRAVAAIRDDLGGGPFIFNLGHGVLPGTPPEHVAELTRMLRSDMPDD